MPNASSSVSATCDWEISSVRTFNAPRTLVWKAWTDPKHLEQWWGPFGFTTTTKEYDLRPGGKWLFTMHGPDGTNYRNDIEFTRVVEPELLEYDHGPSPIFHTTVTFEETGESETQLSMCAVFPTKAERDRTDAKFKAVEGMKQTLSRLEEYLTKI